MANIVSQISVHQQHELLAKLEAAGLTGDLAQKVIESRGNALAKNVVNLISGSWLDFPSYTVMVSYDQTVEQMVKAGKYDGYNADVASFPSNEKGVAEVLVYLVNFYPGISSKYAIKIMGELDPPLRPATLKELLALGVAQPDLQRNNPIIALGSTWLDSNGHVRVPVLYGNVSYRGLRLDWWDSVWFSSRRFAAVRK